MTTLSSDGVRALDEYIDSFKGENLPAFIVGVSNTNEEIYFKGCGTHIINDPSSPEISPDSVMWICSSTKMIVALAGLKLIDQGRIGVNDKVEDYFPQFKNPVIVDTNTGEVIKPAQTAMTIKHLLNFSSGLFYPVNIHNPSELPVLLSNKTVHAEEDPVSAFFKLLIGDYPGIPLKFEPGTDFAYGWSADILGFIIEKVSGKSLEIFCKENIFTPLGMNSTSFFLTPDLKTKLVNLTYAAKPDLSELVPWAGQLEIIEQDPDKLRLLSGSGGLYSTMRDYLTLLRHILQIQKGVNTVVDPILKRETVDDIFVPALTPEGSKSLATAFVAFGAQWGTAMSISTEDKPNGRKKGSAAWGGWAGTSHFIDPATGLAFVFGAQVNPPAMPLWKISMTIESKVYAAIESV